MSNSAPSEFLATLILQNKGKILKPRLQTACKNYSLLEKFIIKNKQYLSLSKPKGGVTAFLNYNFNLKSIDFCKNFIEKENTLLVPSSVYGLENYVRIGFGCKTEIFEKGLENLQKYIDYLKRQKA